MDNKIVTQVIREVRRSLKIWDITRAVSNTNDEIQTRINLINPLFDILGYDAYDIIHEYIVDIKGSKGRHGHYIRKEKPYSFNRV